MTGPDTVHATAVAIAGRGVLIRGRSGAGKSALALDLMAFGAVLIADDRVHLTRRGDRILATCPPVLSGLTEARGLGLLRATPADVTILSRPDRD
ncbi:HPr kinase/phosphorylase [Loktanella sp. DJP18]|uniref:HPr kinase/phosphorylase n=1 Tax=Loktanella sp. DJP18 TaxID=3409788 RepID=UPI003BB68FFC